MKIIEAKQVTKTYTVDHREIRVLDDVSLSVSESEFLVVEGSSGSGKTTLLSLLSGLDKPTSGLVHLFTVTLGGPAFVMIRFYLYGDRAADAVAGDEPKWQAWMNERFPPPTT